MDDSRVILSARPLQFKAVACEKVYLFERRELDLRIQQMFPAQKQRPWHTQTTAAVIQGARLHLELAAELGSITHVVLVGFTHKKDARLRD